MILMVQVFDEYLGSPSKYKKELYNTLDFSKETNTHNGSLFTETDPKHHEIKLEEKLTQKVEVISSRVLLSPAFLLRDSYIETASRDPSLFVGYLFLNRDGVEKGSGISFFYSKQTGLNNESKFDPHEIKTQHEIATNNESAWEKYCSVQGKDGRMIIFKANLFHALDPKSGFGTDKLSAQMIERVVFYVGSK